MSTTDKTAEHWIRYLHLTKHPEGGFYKETYRSEETIEGCNLPDRFPGTRIFSSAIYYLLSRNDVSVFHRLKSDEVLHFYAGDMLHIYILDEEGNLNLKKLGRSADSDFFQCVVPAGLWFGAELESKKGYALIGCTVAPGFDFHDFEIAKREELLRKFPQHEETILRLTRPEADKN